MNYLQLKPGLFWNGILDPGLRVFDIVMETKYGTTYNSYLIKGSDKTALVESAKFKFWDEYKEHVTDLVPISDIDYIIVNHTEPDHAGSIQSLLEINPNIVIVGTGTAITFLKHIVNQEFYSLPVKENDTLSLGGRTLRFFPLPNLHWPDTMYSYLEEDQVLFTCDSFGSHYSHEGILRSTVTDEAGYMDAAKYYFDNIIGPFKDPYMLAALDRIKDLPISMICPGHGPVLDSHIPDFIETTRKWCCDAREPKKTIIMPYVSAYGYTKEIAENITRGLKDSGDVTVRAYDMITSDPAVVLADMAAADAFLFGTPTILGEALKPIWDLTTSMVSPVYKGRYASAFGDYGWSGEGVPHIIERLKQLKLKVSDGFRVRFKPSENQLLDAYEFGYNFGCTILEIPNKKQACKTGARTLVKCLVCGAIFDSSLSVCPVCGVGPENFVPVEDTDTGFHKNTEEIFLVLGGGAAAFNAAKAIRERNATAGITIISNEGAYPYNRPMLTKAMMAGFTDNQMAIEPPAWYEENHISCILNAEVVSIDGDKKQVALADGRNFVYDKCVYALGSECFIPPMEGSSLPEIVAIRRGTDADKIKKLLPNIRKVAVIGGGVLGLEAAWELHKANTEVTILEHGDQIMKRQIDAGTANMLGEIMKGYGMTLITNAHVKGVTGTDHVTGVEFEDGSTIPADLVIVSAGVRANVKIAAAAGVVINRSIVVNSHMETNVSGIYAAGDCAEFNGVNYSLWSEAAEMGRVAGANAAGDELDYEQVNGALTFNGLNTSLYSLGDNGKREGVSYTTVELKDEQKKLYRKYYFANGRLAGGILLGDVSEMAKLTDLIEEKALMSDVVPF